jgi:DNA-binding NarL/FixJ family response regulator
MARHKLRVLLVDDEPAVRVMLRRWLTRQDLAVCALAATGEQALAAARLHRPDAIVLDHRLPDVPGLQLLPELRRLCPTARIVLFTADLAVARMAAADGAAALVKGGALSDLSQTLTAAPEPRPAR